MRPGQFFILAAPGAALLVFFFVIPLATVSVDAFTGAGNAFVRVFGNELFWGGLRGTLVLALTASTFSLLVGFAVALHLSRVNETLRAVLVFFIALPLTFSGLIVAYGFILCYGRAGFITQLLGIVGVDPATFSRLLMQYSL